MNRQRYKLVFNRHRGQLMAVAEIASSIQHHGRSPAGAATMPDLLPSALRFSLLAVALALAMNTVAHAQILGDRNAPRNQQPTVLVTPNGVPVINIQTPGTAGVSVNRYRQFDVGANGAILNNAQGTTTTQLGGYVAGNPWLATGAARVIVNQVNSANPSYLRGYLEVAGGRAQVVVANPAGITCSGCGFINASRATLTTGVPQVVNGNLESYRVASGAVSIEGNGMDASRTDYAEIIARAVQVNAGIWAPQLKVSAGLNTVSADHASVVPGVVPADAAPALAIDVAQLGGMYAGHIYLTSTEHGVGVRNAGSIGASVGQAVVTADGRLENSGSLTATGLLAVQTTGGLSNTGELGSKSAATLNTTTVDNSGNIASAGPLAVQASGAVQNSGSLGGQGSVQIDAASLDNSGNIASAGALAVQASGVVQNSGSLSGQGSVQIDAASLGNRGSIGSDANLVVQTSAGISNAGTLQAMGDTNLAAATVDNSGTVLASQGTLTVSSSAGASNSGRMQAAQSVILKADSLTNSGSLGANAVLAVQTAGALRNTGQMGGQIAATLNTATLDNAGSIASAGTLTVQASGAMQNSGSLSGQGSIQITAASLGNRGSIGSDAKLVVQTSGGISNAGTLQAMGDTNLAAATVDNSGTVLASQGTLTVSSSAGASNSGRMQAAQSVILKADSLTNSGSLGANAVLAVQTAGALRNTGQMGGQIAATFNTATLDNAGSIASAGTLNVQASGAVQNSGSIGGEGSVQIAAASLDNGNSIGSNASLAMQIAGGIRNSGTLQATGDAAVNAATLDNSGALRASQGALNVATSGGTNNSGRIEAAQSVTLKAASLGNSGGINAGDRLRIDAAQGVSNSGAVGANGSVEVQAASLSNQGTLASSRDAVSVVTSGTLSNQGQVSAAQSLTLTAAGIDNHSGKLSANDIRIDSQNQSFDNRQGNIGAQRDIRIASGAFDNGGGNIVAQGKLDIRSGEIGNDGGLLQAGDALTIDAGSSIVRNSNSGSTRGIVAQGPLSVAAGALVNRGNVSSNGDITLKTASLDNDAGVIGANGSLTVESNGTSNRGGAMQARQGVDIRAGSGSVDNSGGLMRSDGTVNVQAASVRNDNTQGQNQGIEGATINIAAADISNRQGALRGDTIALTASQRIDNTAGLISATNSASLTDANPASRTLAVDNSNGTIIAGQQTSVLAYSFTGSGKLLSQKDLRLDLVASILHTGQIGASGDIDLRTAGTFTNAGAVGAGGTLMLTAATIDNQASGSLVGNTLRLKATDIHTFINRGLIDGVNTIIESSTVNNIGTGRIYGDNIAIGADVLNNQAETVDGVTSAPVIAARNRLDIGAGVINNSEHALIYSVGDMAIGGALDANKRATGSAREINNTSATINADGNLTIAAGAINNTNAHLETTDQTGPGNRIVNFRLNGSSQLIDGKSVLIINQDSGQLIAPENWRAMGDEDNFRLLLPSTQYPFEKYGPPFTYSRGASGTVGVAYIPKQAAWVGDYTSTPAVPEQFVYGPDDRIWDIFGIPRPTTVVPEEPVAPSMTISCGGEYDCANPFYQREYDAWLPKHEQWKAIHDAAMPLYQALNDAIAAFNNNLHGRMVKEWTIYDGTEQITRTVVTKSDPGMITSGGNMNLVAGSVNNYASQIIAGGTLAGDSVNGTAINNSGPLGRQRVVSTGSASYTYVKSHTFSADDRRYDNAPYQSQDIVTNFQLDVTPTSGAGPNRANSVRAVASSVSGASGATSGAASIRIANLDLTLPNNALYRINAGPRHQQCFHHGSNGQCGNERHQHQSERIDVGLRDQWLAHRSSREGHQPQGQQHLCGQRDLGCAT